MRKPTIALVSALFAAVTWAQEPEATQQQLDADSAALKRLSDSIRALSEVSEEASDVARAKFIPQCQAVTGNSVYCTCVFDSLPVAYLWYIDEPWLLFVLSVHRRMYVGEEAAAGFQPGELTDQARFDLYVSARDVVQSCSSTNR